VIYPSIHFLAVPSKISTLLPILNNFSSSRSFNSNYGLIATSHELSHPYLDSEKIPLISIESNSSGHFTIVILNSPVCSNKASLWIAALQIEES